MNKKLKPCYCDGICESCSLGRHYSDTDGEYDTCDPDKIEGLDIIAPTPLSYKK